MKLPNSQFIFWLSKTYGKLPSDNFFEEMNPWEKIWLYESWLYEVEQKVEVEKNLAIFVGSFSNYEMAKEIMKKENPEYKDENAEETAQKLHKTIVEEENKQPKKKRKKKKAK